MTQKNVTKNVLSSSGHRLGQIIGDWWEEKVIYPLLLEVTNSLDLFLDNRFVSRSCRSGKIQWADVEDNIVDYDYVIELGGTQQVKGVPVAFLESFWRRGARHSKDKVRDDTNKLLPMRDTYPTARFLAIAACGELTEPAREYVRSRNVELFFISKENIVSAFASIGVSIDYPDTLPEDQKNDLVQDLVNKFDDRNQEIVSEQLKSISGGGAFTSFKQRIKSSLTATPQQVRIFSVTRTAPLIFNSIQQSAMYLAEKSPKFPSEAIDCLYEFEVTFSDGTEFARSLNTLNDVRELNQQLLSLVNHFENLEVQDQ